MNAQDLKNSILQLAVQGKLVDQRPEEGTAKELLAQIKAEKEQLIKEKKIKKAKPLPEITEDEIPFEIPESWEWTCLSELTTEISLNDGDWVLSKDMVEMGNVKLIQLGSIGNCEYIEKGFKYLTEEHFYEIKGTPIHEGYLLVNRLIGDRMLECILPKIDGTLMTAVDVCWVAPQVNHFDIKYIMYALASEEFQRKVKELGRGTTRFRISKGNLVSIYFPLPPLAEQQRIVAKIEEILPYIEQYDKAYTKLETLNKKFPKDMKKSILQIAMQGKLVEQRAEEGTAHELYEQIVAEKANLIQEGKIKKEKPLPEITEDEIPFEIPSSWKWVRFSEIIDVRDGTHDSPRYYDVGIPLVTSKNISGGSLDFSNTKYISKADADKINERSNVDTGDILFAMIGSIGNPIIVNKDREFCVKNVALFKNFAGDKIDINYVYWFLTIEQYSLKKIASGGVQSFVSLKVLRNYLMPLPPLAEQKRIVAKIEEILPYCDQLVK